MASIPMCASSVGRSRAQGMPPHRHGKSTDPRTWHDSSMDELCSDGALAVRRMRDDPADIKLMTDWLERPHVKEWWDPDEPPLDIDAVRKKYASRTEDYSPTTSCILELEG